MRLESKKYLYDIARASELAMQFIAGKSFADYGSSAMLRSAVERQLEIVGEALAQLARIDPATASRISEPRRIICFSPLTGAVCERFLEHNPTITLHAQMAMHELFVGH